MRTFIVTVTAEDQVGIVHRVTGTIETLRGNILELSQTVLQGYFTIIFAVEFENAPEADSLRKAITEEGRDLNLNVAVLEAHPEGLKPPVPEGERFILTVLGQDHVGNIHGISGCLASQGVNILDLHARADNGTFSLVMEAFLPPSVSPRTLREGLEGFGRELGLEAFVQHENIFQATNEPTPVRVAPRFEKGRESVSGGAARVSH